MSDYVVETRDQDSGWEEDTSFDQIHYAYDRIAKMRRGPLGRSCMYRIVDKRHGTVCEVEEDIQVEAPQSASGGTRVHISHRHEQPEEFSVTDYERLVLDLAVQERSEPSVSWLYKKGFEVSDSEGRFTEKWPEAIAVWKLAIAKAMVDRIKAERKDCSHHPMPGSEPS